jgi:hypothetical protein
MVLAGQWYILFNVIAAVASAPPQLAEAADVFGLRGRARWRRLFLPAAFPGLVTGWITAAGGAWNGTIVAEYLQAGGALHATTGLGSLIKAGAAADATVGAKPNLTRTPNLTRVHCGAPALAPQHRAPLVRIHLRGGAHRGYAVGSLRLPPRTAKQRRRHSRIAVRSQKGRVARGARRAQGHRSCAGGPSARIRHIVTRRRRRTEEGDQGDTE